MSKTSSEALGKKLSYELRHNPNNDRDEQGAVSLSDLTVLLNATVAEIEEAVRLDGKGRFEIAGGRVSAKYGHSVTIGNEILDEVTQPGILFHGSKESVVPLIREQGILPMGRNYVHLAKQVQGALDVASRRKGNSVLILVDANRMIQDGYKVYATVNSDILLTGSVPPAYILEYRSA